MTWFALSNNQTEAAKSEGVHFFVAVDADFPSGHVRLWSGVGNLVFGGNTFSGAGELGKIAVVSDQAGLTSQKKSYQLSGVDLTLVPESELLNSFGRSITEYFGFLTTAGALVDTPETNFEGRIDSCRRLVGLQPTFEINAEHRLSLLDIPDGWRYTHEHQQQFYSGDDGFILLDSIQGKELLWGGNAKVPGIANPGRYLPSVDTPG